MITVIIAAPFLFVVFITWALFLRRDKHIHVSPRFIRSWDVLGILNLIEALRELSNHEHLQASAARLAKHGNTYTTWFKGTKATFTCDEEIIKAVFATNVSDFRFASGRRAAFHQLLGHGIFFVEGAEWSMSRKLLRPSFANEAKSIPDAVQPHIADFVIAAQRQQASLGYVELRSLFHSLTLDVFTHVFLGQSCFSLRHDSSNTERTFEEAYDACMQRVVRAFVIYPFDKLLPVREHRRDMQIVHDFVDMHVKRNLADRNTEKSETMTDTVDRHRSVLEELSDTTRDPIVLRSECLNLLFAGRDSTASLMTNCFYFLARLPSVWQALREEVYTLDSEETLDFARLKALPYLQACLRECKLR